MESLLVPAQNQYTYLKNYFLFSVLLMEWQRQRKTVMIAPANGEDPGTGEKTSLDVRVVTVRSVCKCVEHGWWFRWLEAEVLSVECMGTASHQTEHGARCKCDQSEGEGKDMRFG